MPDEVFDQRLGAAVGSLLGLDYRAVHQALALRRDVEESAAGWKLVQTSQPKAAETEGEDLEHIATFASTFQIGQVVAVAVQADEQLDRSNTDFYLAVVEEQPVRLEKAERSQGNLLEAGRWVFAARWLEFVREDEDTGARHYKIVAGDVVKHDVVLRMPQTKMTP